jgi:hypothetical protein
MRSAFKNFLPFLLGDAAEDADNLVPAPLLDFDQAIEDLLLGFVPYAAGVVKQ